MKRFGAQTLKFDNPVTILETASIVGPKEAQGPMADYFDKCFGRKKLGKRQKVKL